MAKSKSAKEIKRLKKWVKETTAANLALEKRVRKLKKDLGARKQQIADLQRRLVQAPPITEVRKSPALGFGDRDGRDIASTHRTAWKQHSYLLDRYEFHLRAGAAKARARHLANEDLKQEYGTGYGYTEEELGAILS